MNRRWAWITGACVAAVAFANVWLAASPADSSRRSRTLDVIDGTVLTPTLRAFGPVTGDALGPAPAPTAYAFVPALAVDVLEAAPRTASNAVPHFARRRAMDWEVPPTNFTLVAVQDSAQQTPGWIGDLLRANTSAGSDSPYDRNGGGASGTGGGSTAQRGGGGVSGVGGRAARTAADNVSATMGRSVLEAGNAGGGDIPGTAPAPANDVTRETDERETDETESNAPGASSPARAAPSVQATSGGGSQRSGARNDDSGSTGSASTGSGSTSSESSGSGTGSSVNGGPGNSNPASGGSETSPSPAELPATAPSGSTGAPNVPAPVVPGLGTSQPDTTGSSVPGAGLTSSGTGGADVPAAGGGALPPLPIDSPLPSFPSTVPGDPDADPAVPMDPHSAAVSTLEGTPPDPAAPHGSTPSRVKDGSLALVSPSAVPEPAVLTLLGLAVLGVARARFRASRP